MNVAVKLKNVELTNNESEVSDPPHTAKSISLFYTVTILLLLYFLQAVPMGTSGALTILLRKRGASYSDITIYTITSMPFSLKVLWAPIVDSFKILNFGRRKSCFVLVQTAISILLFISAKSELCDRWGGEYGTINITMLTIFYTSIYFLLATQDIIVDGWAIEILPVDKKKFASTCNTIGQSIGFYIFNLMLLLFSSDTKHENSLAKYFPNFTINQSKVLLITSYVTMASTVLAAMVLPEVPHKTEDIKKVYKTITTLIKLPIIQNLSTFLVTSKIGFAFIDAIYVLKCIDMGVQNDVIAVGSFITFIIGVFASYLITSLIESYYRTMDLIAYLHIIRTISFPILIFCFKQMAKAVLLNNRVLIYSWFIIASIILSIPREAIVLAQIAYFAQISDTVIGGSYMTLLNTLNNLGFKWPAFVVLKLLDYCQFTPTASVMLFGAVGTFFSYGWYIISGKKAFNDLGNASSEAWLVKNLEQSSYINKDCKIWSSKS